MNHTTADFKLLFATRMVRMFAYGFLAVALALYLAQVGLSGTQIGVLISLTLAGDAAISLWITTNADRIGRKRMLIGGALLMLLAGSKRAWRSTCENTFSRRTIEWTFCYS